MSRKPGHIHLTSDDREFIQHIQKKAEKYEKMARRAKILLLRADDMSIDQIANAVKLDRKSVMSCLDKYKEQECVDDVIYDEPGRGRKKKFSNAEEEWIIKIFKSSPEEWGYPLKKWTYDKLTDHIRNTAEKYGYAGLSDIKRSTVYSIVEREKISSLREEHFLFHRTVNRMIVIRTLFRRKYISKQKWNLEYIKLCHGEVFSLKKKESELPV